TTSLMLQPLPAGDDEVGDVLAVGFDTPLVAPSAKPLLADVKGLQSLGWLARPGGAHLLYIAPTDGDDGKPQAWSLDPAGGKPVQLTRVEGGIGNLKASPTGNAIAFTVDVKMDKTVNELHPDLPKADARI